MPSEAAQAKATTTFHVFRRRPLPAPNVRIISSLLQARLSTMQVHA
jgi:hypothetical protein